MIGHIALRMMVVDIKLGTAPGDIMETVEFPVVVVSLTAIPVSTVSHLKFVDVDGHWAISWVVSSITITKCPLILTHVARTIAVMMVRIVFVLGIPCWEYPVVTSVIEMAKTLKVVRTLTNVSDAAVSAGSAFVAVDSTSIQSK